MKDKQLSRREFISQTLCQGLCAGLTTLALTSGSTALSGCNSAPNPPRSRKIKLGQINQFNEGINVRERERLAIFRSGQSLRASSLVCTHQTCLLRPSTLGLTCPCHGSQFDLTGTPTNGPATEPLPWYKLTQEQDSLYVHLDQKVGAEWELEIDGTGA